MVQLIGNMSDSEFNYLSKADRGDGIFIDVVSLNSGKYDNNIKKTYDQGYYVGVINPTQDACDKLWSIIDNHLETPKSSIENTAVFGYIKTTGNNFEQVSFQKPVLPNEDINFNQEDYANEILESIAVQHAKLTEKKPILTEVGGGGDPVSLYNYAHQYVFRKQYCYPVSKGKSTVNCYYQIVTRAQAVWVQEQEGASEFYDYYFVEQFLVLSPSPGYFANDTYNEGWYVNWYNINLYPKDYSGNSKVYMVQNAPGTTQSASTVTSSISETTGFSVGFFGDQGTASFSHSVNIGHSQSFSIPDVTVKNLSNSTGNNAQWDFIMPYVSDSGGEITSTPVEMSVSTFQPITMALWQVKTSVDGNDGKSKKGFNMLYEFNLQYVYTYISDGERKDSTYKPDATSDSFNIPFPPIGSKRP